MSVTCPNCISLKTEKLADLYRKSVALHGPAPAACEDDQCDRTGETRILPPRRRPYAHFVVLLFLTAASLTLPAHMLLENTAAARSGEVSARTLPPGAQIPATDAAKNGPSAGVWSQSLPAGAFLMIDILAIVLITRILQATRVYNQSVWGPAFERWSTSWYCNDCRKIFVNAPSAVPREKKTPLVSAGSPAA